MLDGARADSGQGFPEPATESVSSEASAQRARRIEPDGMVVSSCEEGQFGERGGNRGGGDLPVQRMTDMVKTEIQSLGSQLMVECRKMWRA